MVFRSCICQHKVLCSEGTIRHYQFALCSSSFGCIPTALSLPALHAILGGPPAVLAALQQAGNQLQLYVLAHVLLPGNRAFFSFLRFQVCNSRTGKNPVHFPHLSHLRGFSTDDYLINAFFGRWVFPPMEKALYLWKMLFGINVSFKFIEVMLQVLKINNHPNFSVLQKFLVECDRNL